MDNDNIESVVKEPTPKNMLDGQLAESADAKQAIASIEDREHTQELLHNIMLKEGDGKEVVGKIIYKDQSNTVIQSSKNVGYRYDSSIVEGLEINQRVAVVMVGDQEKAMTESEYNKYRENDRALNFQVENDHSTGHLEM